VFFVDDMGYVRSEFRGLIKEKASKI